MQTKHKRDNKQNKTWFDIFKIECGPHRNKRLKYEQNRGKISPNHV